MSSWIILRFFCIGGLIGCFLFICIRFSSYTSFRSTSSFIIRTRTICWWTGRTIGYSISITIWWWWWTCTIRSTKEQDYDSIDGLTFIFHYLIFSFFVVFFVERSESFPRGSLAWLLERDFLAVLLLFSAFFKIWLEICRPGRNLLVVEEGDVCFLFPLDFFSLPFFIALELSRKKDLIRQSHLFDRKRERKWWSTRMLMKMISC